MRLLPSKFYILNSTRGQVAMSLVMVIGGMLIIIAAILTFIILSFINSSFGFKASSQALSIASAGVEDALMQLARNKDFSVSNYCVPSSDCGADDAYVVVTQNSPSPGLVTITSLGRSSRRERKIKAIASVDSNTGQVNLMRWDLLTE